MATKRPNLLFVFADQLGAVYMGCYGHPQVQTPNLDRLAAESVLFRNAYTAAPLCTPFRGTLFTGRYPIQTGIFKNEQKIPPTETTLADLFNDAGYATTYVGKWHMAGLPRKIWVAPEDRGGFRDFVGWDCGHVRHIDQKYFDGDDPTELVMSGHETDALTDIACERLRVRAADDRPFCMVVSYQAPHPFCGPPDEYAKLYRGKSLEFRPTVDHDARFTGYGEQSADMPVTEWTERYFGEVTHLDAAIGRLMAEARSLGLMDNTVIVFTSDHGDMGGCRGRFEKSVPYEEATQIPVIIRLPGREAGRETDALFSSVDFLPTVLGLCGLPATETAEGVDYSGLVCGCVGADAAEARRSPGGSPAREDARPPGEARPEGVREFAVMQLRDWSCIRSGDCKLTLDPEGAEPKELYRLSSDPFEQRNLVGDEREQGTVDALRTTYLNWLREVRGKGLCRGKPDKKNQGLPRQTDAPEFR